MAHRHTLSKKLDQTARQLDILYPPLNEWWPEDKRLGGELGRLDSDVLRRVIAPLGEIASRVTKPLAVNALASWTAEGDGRPKQYSSVGFARVSAGKIREATEYDGILAMSAAPKSPALRLRLRMAQGLEYMESSPRVDSAELCFGQLAEDGTAVNGVWLPLTEYNLNHGNPLDKIPSWKGAEGLVMLVEEFNLALDSIGNLVAERARM